MTRRPDPTETRARELALAAGVDPDARIAKIGSSRGNNPKPTIRETMISAFNSRHEYHVRKNNRIRLVCSTIVAGSTLAMLVLLKIGVIHF